MIYKGIVEQIVDPYTIKVRIPKLHSVKASNEYIPTESLPNATVCTLPKTHPNIYLGDIVMVGFENNDYSKPVILGHLYKESFGEHSISTEMYELIVTSHANLPAKTQIGKVTAEELSHLSGTAGNLQKQLDLLQEKITKLEGIIDSLK